MKLRSQMLLAGVLTLAVPLVGWQSVKQLYGSLQRTRIDEQTLKVANMRLALAETRGMQSVLASGMRHGNGADWYAETSAYPIFIDGYDDDWQTLVSEPLVLPDNDNGPAPRLRVASHEGRLYLFLSVVDDAVVYHVPPVPQVDAAEGEQPDRQATLVNGDSVELLVQTTADAGDRPVWQHALFRTIAPGPVEAVRASDAQVGFNYSLQAGTVIRSWDGLWIQNEDGYQLEISLPLPASGVAVGLAVVDIDSRDEKRERWAGNLDHREMQRIHRQRIAPAEVRTSLLFHEDPLVERRLAGWTLAGSRARLFDSHGRLLADVNKLYDRDLPEEITEESNYTGEGIWDAILLRVFAFFVAGDLPLLSEYSGTPASLHLDSARRASLKGTQAMTSRYVTDENDRVLGTLVSIASESAAGYLLYESNEEHASAYAGSELARLFSLLLLVSLLAGSGLLIFALVLSSRIRRLSLEAQHAVGADGRVRGLPGSDARDEIGDLSRKLSTLLARSAAYTHYLEALSSRLSHELRTPLSVVRTSIENIDRDRLDEQSLMLIDRASGGADHLGSIIRALLESTRLEQTVQQAQMQAVSLRHWLEASLARYQQVYPDSTFEAVAGKACDIRIMASPELLSQAFDKLADNAVSFSHEGPIVLSIQVEHRPAVRGKAGDCVVLLVSNHGDPLDEDVISRLFDPMYSDRRSESRLETHELHLGLGLYIVKMIAEVHDGSVVARNDQGWVRIGMCLPIS